MVVCGVGAVGIPRRECPHALRKPLRSPWRRFLGGVKVYQPNTSKTSWRGVLSPQNGRTSYMIILGIEGYTPCIQAMSWFSMKLVPSINNRKLFKRESNRCTYWEVERGWSWWKIYFLQLRLHALKEPFHSGGVPSSRTGFRTSLDRSVR